MYLGKNLVISGLILLASCNKGLEKANIESGSLIESESIFSDPLESIIIKNYSAVHNVLESISPKGPFNKAGRIMCLSIDHSNNNHLIIGTHTGGMWNSTDKGQSWTVIDDFLPSLTCASIAQDHFNPLVYYLASYNTFKNENNEHISDIYVSEDGGQSFDLIIFNDSINVPSNSIKIISSPTISGELYVLCNRYTPTFFSNNYKDILKSTDFGQTFISIIDSSFRTSQTSILDFDIAPDNEIRIITKNGYYTSPSSSTSPYLFNLVLDSAAFGNYPILNISTSNPNIVHIMSKVNGSYVTQRTIDAGLTWDTLGPYSCGSTGKVLVTHPLNSNIIVNGATRIYASSDAGNNFSTYSFNGIDFRQLVFDTVGNYLYALNDQGIGRLNTSPFHIPYDPQYKEALDSLISNQQIHSGDYKDDETDRYIIGLQDAGTYWNKFGDGFNLKHLNTGDGAYCFFHRQDSNTAYISYQGGKIQRSNSIYSPLNTANFTHSILNNLDSDGNGKIDEGYIYLTPFWVNSSNSDQLYIPTKKRLWKSLNKGDDWIPTSSMYDDFNFINNLTIDGVSKTNPIVYWTVQDSLFGLKDAATADSSEVFAVALTGVPSYIKTSYTSDSTVYLIVRETISNNVLSVLKLYRIDGLMGTNPTITNIDGNMPLDVYINCIQPSSLSDSVLIVGTNFGLFSSTDAGSNWNKETDFPNVRVKSMKVRPSDNRLFLFTYGRGVWTADFKDISSLDLGFDNSIPNWRAYPNPTNNNLISLSGTMEDNTSLTMYNSSGLLLWHKPLNELTNISLGEISSGLYFIKIESDHKSQIIKIIKK